MDIRISFFSYLINTTVCTAVLAFLWLQTRRHAQGVGLWVAGFGLSLLSVTLLGLRGLVPDLLSVLLSNLGLVVANYLILIGLEHFLRRRGQLWPNAILLLAFSLIHAYFTYGSDNLSIRTINFSIALIAINLQIVWLLLYRTHTDMRLATRGLSTIFFLAVVVSAVRISGELTAPSDNNLLNASSFQMAIVLAYQVLVLILAFGLSLMVTQHLLIDLRGDIVQRKQVEADLRDSETRFKAILSAIPDLMFRLSEQGVHLDFYAPDPDKLFVSADDFIGKTVQEVLPSEVGATYLQHIRTCLQSGEPQTFEYALNFEEDDLRSYEARMVALKADEVLTMVRDITERKHAESELVQHREHLEILVSQRTQELQDANQELLRLSRVKDEFVSNVSHELRTPLTNLVLRQELIKLHPEKLEVYLNVMERETRRLGHIIESLLDLSRLDQKRIEIDLQALDLNELVGHYVADREELAKEQNLSLSFSTKADEPVTQADEGLMGQVLSILLTNAMNYTPAGGLIHLSTLGDPDGGSDRVGFRVVDSGLGISEEDMPKLFERFFRGQAALESGVAGTGLGLALARQIVDQHGGTIEVVSQAKPGEGARFTVWLPAAESKIIETI